MANSDQDPSMDLLQISGKTLASKELAATIASAVIAKLFGQKELDRQSPLVVLDANDRWIVRGEGNKNKVGDGPQLAIGEVEIEILKRNCQILKFARKAYLLPDKP